MRQWRQAVVTGKVDHAAVHYSTDREWFTLAVPGNAEPRHREGRPKTEPAGRGCRDGRAEPRKPGRSPGSRLSRDSSEEGNYWVRTASRSPKSMDLDIKTGNDPGKKQIGIYKL